LVYYAYQMVTDSTKVTIGDAFVLNSLGVIWGDNQCQGKCATKATSGQSAAA